MQTAAKHGSHRSKQGRGGPHTPDSGSTRLRASRPDETEVDTGRRHGLSQCWSFLLQQHHKTGHDDDDAAAGSIWRHVAAGAGCGLGSSSSSSPRFRNVQPIGRGHEAVPLWQGLASRSTASSARAGTRRRAKCSRASTSAAARRCNWRRKSRTGRRLCQCCASFERADPGRGQQ
jgi:hypothetical protein